MRAFSIFAIIPGLICLTQPACQMHAEEKEHAHEHAEHNKIIVTTPQAKDVRITQQYVCQIHSQQHIEVRALAGGRLDEIPIREGQLVKQGDVLFRIVPILYQAKLDAELAEVKLAEIECENTRRLLNEKIPVVSKTELALFEAKLAKARAKAKQAEAELSFTTIKAPFDGIVDRMMKQQGSTIKEEEVLTKLSDNSKMWVFYNVPEARYYDYMADLKRDQGLNIELVLANGTKFPHRATSVIIESEFNNETGNIAFRADIPNPDRLLRHGQTGNILIHRTLKNVIVIPQRATFEILDKQFVYVVGSDGKVHQREIAIQQEMDDIYVIKSGITENDKIVLDGVRQVHEGEKIEFEFKKPEEALADQKFHAE
ncbi:efflux RND transporter periplasmic adaptor subunit [soil metagenome]